MGFGSWFRNLFKHVNNHNLAGALAAAKTTIDNLGAIEKWDWLPQFDDAATKAIAALNAWQPGQPKDQIIQSLNLSVEVLSSVEGLSAKDKQLIAIYVGAAQSALAFMG